MDNNVDRHFDLWFDESGSFDDTALEYGQEASLVGGIIVENNCIDYNIATTILEKVNPQDNVHAVDDKDYAKQIRIIKKLQDYSCKPVVFQNTGKKSIFDDRFTYLNVCAEGIAKLFSTLVVKYDHFSLNICIATRKDNTKVYSRIIPEEDYKRIKERVSLEMLRNGTYNSFVEDWVNDKNNITFADARMDSRLQLCDIVCNTFLTRNSRKFDDSQKQYLTEVFSLSSMYYYPVLSGNEHETVEFLINHGKLGEALFVCLFSSRVNDRKTIALDIVDKLSNLKQEKILPQLSVLEQRINIITRFKTNHLQQKKALEFIRNELLLALNRKKIECSTFAFNCELYLYDVYSHLGSEKGAQQYKNCKMYLDTIDDVYNKLILLTKLDTRNAMDLKNMFNNEECLTKLTNVIEKNEKILELLIENDDKIFKNSKNELLAKAYGSRLQLWSLLYNDKDSEYIKNMAKHDYENALKNFADNFDKERQYNYYSQFKAVAGQYKEAVKLLLKTEQIKFKDDKDVDLFLQKLAANWGEQTLGCKYQYLAFLRILVNALEHDDSYGHKLWDLFQNNLPENFFIIKAERNNAYPMNMVYWLYGECLRFGNKENDGKDAAFYYDLAVGLDKNTNPGLTIKFIYLGVKASKVLFYKKSTDSIKEYKALKNEIWNSLKGTIRTYWQCIENDDYEGIIKKARLIS